MNSEVIESGTPAKPPLRQRLRSWKWWVYGDVNSMPLKKPPKWYRAQIFLAIFFWIFLGIHPLVSTWINSTPPEFSQLQIVHGKVIYTSRLSPHLGIETESGETLRMEYPGFLSNYGRPVGGTRSLGPDNERVFGCMATVWFDVPKYTLWSRHRVWQITCDNGQASALYSDFVASSARKMGLIHWSVSIFFIMPFLMFIYLIRYRRGFYER